MHAARTASRSELSELLSRKSQLRCVPLHLSITAMLADPNYRSYCRAGSRCVLLNLSLTAMLADPITPDQYSVFRFLGWSVSHFCGAAFSVILACVWVVYFVFHNFA